MFIWKSKTDLTSVQFSRNQSFMHSTTTLWSRCTRLCTPSRRLTRHLWAFLKMICLLSYLEQVVIKTGRLGWVGSHESCIIFHVELAQSDNRVFSQALRSHCVWSVGIRSEKLCGQGGHFKQWFFENTRICEVPIQNYFQFIRHDFFSFSLPYNWNLKKYLYIHSLFLFRNVSC